MSARRQLSPQQLRAAWLVALDELTRREIAEQVGVGERTLYDWLKDESFQLEVELCCRRIVKELVAPALHRLKRNIKSGKASEANKAIELALKVAGWLDKQSEQETGGGISDALALIRQRRAAGAGGES